MTALARIPSTDTQDRPEPNTGLPKLYTCRGEKMTLCEAIEVSGLAISVDTVRSRLDAGWPLARALSAPVKDRLGQRGASV